MQFKKYTLMIFIFPAAFILFFMAFDPFGVFLRREPLLFGLGMRTMGACAINSGKFDSYLLGTSMVENTSARETEKLFHGGKFANIAMSGSNFYERSFALKRLLKNGNVKKIVYSLESYPYINQLRERKDYPSSNFSYLYDRSRLNNLKLYFSMPTLKAIRNQWKWRANYSKGNYKDYDKPYYWADRKGNREHFGGLDKWFASKNNNQIRDAFSSIVNSAKKANATPLADTQFSDADLARVEKAKEYCYEYVIKFVEEHPSTEFYIFFPPYSRIRYAIWYQSDKTSALIHQHVVRYFAEMAAKYKNLHVYGFEDQAFLDDIALYKDTSHYHPSINTLINTAMAKNTNQLTSENVDEYLRTCEERALNFDLKGLAAQIDNYLKNSQDK